jgi:hypothetical protein
VKVTQSVAKIRERVKHPAPALVLVPAPENRGLADIENDLSAALTLERKNFYEIGALLIEAKDKVEHGDWLPWLKKHFGPTGRTAENYMSAAAWAAKFETVSNLKLRPRAAYWLSRPIALGEIESIRKEVEAKVLERAKKQWVGDVDCADLYASIARKRNSADVGPRLDLESYVPEPVPPALRQKALQCKLNGLVKALCKLAPDIADLVGAYVKTEKISKAAALLLAIVAARHE